MRVVLDFAVLGFAAGAVYTLLAQGLVILYRASGILNFAQGAFAMVGGYLYYDLRVEWSWPLAAAIIVSSACIAALSFLFYWVIIRKLIHSSALTRVVATLGIFIVLQAAATLHYQDTTVFVPEMLPTNVVHLGALDLPADRLWVVAVAILITGLLMLGSRVSRFGLATTAVAESRRIASSIGISPNSVSAVNWAIGGALAGFAGVIIAPITGLNVDSISLLVVDAMAVALIASFRSFGIVLIAGLGLGIAQSEATRYVTFTGAVDALPFIVIILFLVVTGRSLPLKDYFLERLPRLGNGRFRPAIVLPAVAIYSILALTVMPASWTDAFTVSGIGAIYMLSLVVLTGYTGQLSLAEFALGGLGALAAAQLAFYTKAPFELSLLFGVVCATIAGLIFAIPALRTRGVNLAVVTLGLGVAVEAIVFFNPRYTGGSQGSILVGPQRLFGVDIDAIKHSDRYSVVIYALLLFLGWLVCNVRRGAVGRRLIAVRTNERAAAALGINVFGAKIYGFGMSAAIAGVAGILAGFESYQVVFTNYDPFSSINIVALAVVGGIGYASGPLAGLTLVAGGMATILTNYLFGTTEWLVLVGGIFLLLLLLQNGNGIADQTAGQLRALGETIRRRTGRAVADSGVAAGDESEMPPGQRAEPAVSGYRKVVPGSIEIEGLSVQFGGVIALADVDLIIKTNEILGVIGPNGAGKSTLIDSVTGFNRPQQGRIDFDGRSLEGLPPHRRARLGVTRSFQSLELFDDLTVRENLLTASDGHGGGRYATDLVWRRSERLSDAAISVIFEIGLDGSLDRQVSELPYGQRRLVAIARALVSEPSIVMLDEPAAGLDSEETAALGTVLQKLVAEWEVGIVVVEHDLSMIMRICDRVAVLDFGRKIADGTADEVRASPAVRAAYLGTDYKAPAGNGPGGGALAARGRDAEREGDVNIGTGALE